VTTIEPKQVINLSSIELSADQTHVLSFGPKFCPTPGKVNKLGLLEDTTEGMRKLRLKEYFLDEDTPNQIKVRPKFYKKTFWCPPAGRDDGLDAYCSSVMARVKSFQPCAVKRRNITRTSQQAINDLRKLVDDCAIRIIPADKGGAVVVQDYEDYKAEALRQLTDEVTYEPLDEDPTKTIAEHSNELLQQLLDGEHISETTYKWGKLDTDKTRCHTFYHLPKVHKNKEKPPGRPIVSGIGGPTENLSKLVDHWLQPIVHALPSFVQDTTHFLRVVEQWKEIYEPLPPETLIVTVDVVGLYTNIPHEEVPISILEALQEFSAPEAPPFPLLVKIINHVLENNVFTFDQQAYRQKFGTAMGTPMAPSIANIFMYWLEKNLLARCPWPIETWKRYIDDIVLLWFHGKERLLHFLEWINTLHHSIKFTAQYGTTIPYLDTTLSIVDGKLTTDLYVKPTDANMCLPFHSCHPRHCTRSIPYSQCLRLRRICSEDHTFLKRAQELKEKLQKRGYPSKLIQDSIDKVAALPRETTLIYKEKEQTERVPVIITHNPQNPPLSNWLKEYMPILHSSTRMKKAVPKPPIVGERNCRNLRSLLMPSKLPRKTTPTPPNTQESIPRPPDHSSSRLPSPDHQTGTPPPPDQAPDPPSPSARQLSSGCYKCTRLRCVLCQHHLQETRTFFSASNHTQYTIRDHLSCRSSNVVYLLDCARCQRVQYVGETGQTMQKRLYGHRHNIKSYNSQKNIVAGQKSYTPEDTMVAKHFNQQDHLVSDMKCTIIEQLHTTSVSVRRRREKFWRHQLQTNYPDGLNVFD
jgi:hypothetical protein